MTVAVLMFDLAEPRDGYGYFILDGAREVRKFEEVVSGPKALVALRLACSRQISAVKAPASGDPYWDGATARAEEVLGYSPGEHR